MMMLLPKTTVIILFFFSLNCVAVTDINTDQLRSLIEKDQGLVLIDVRTEAELAVSGTIDAPRLSNIPAGLVVSRVPNRYQNRDTPIVLFCDTNQRSPVEAGKLSDLGYTNVYNYSEGLEQWLAAKLPVEADNAPNSMLYHKPQQVTEGVWSAIGATAPPSYFNSGHNNNLSFIITKEAVVVINAGDNYLLAQSLHNEIKALTDLPVKYVILENGQGHAMLGSNYWQEQGAKIVAHKDTAHEIEEYGHQVLERMMIGRRDKAVGTKLSKPDITFEEEYIIELGGERIEVLNLGPAHSPGDVVVWLPKKKLVVSGDVSFHVRLLPVFEHTDTDGWIETWDKFLQLGAEIVIPGHGNPTNYEQVTKYTRDYLAFMRDKIRAVIDAGGDLQDAYKIDQTSFSHLDTYYELSQRNAGRIFREMEFEF